MKISIDKAAKRLSLHPCELVMELASLVSSFEELYPQIDDGYVRTLRQMDHERFGPDKDSADESGRTDVEVPELSKQLSESAQQVVCVLCRKKHWGSHKVHHDTIRNHYCRAIPDLDSAITELLNAEILGAKGSRDHYSLNTKIKARIEALCKAAGGEEG